MIFKQYDPDAAAAMFRPHRALYAYDVRNQPEDQWVERLVNYVDAIKTLTAAFGDPIYINKWEEVVPIAFNQSLDAEIVVKKSIDKDSWYLRQESGNEEIYLTAEEQLSYLVISGADIKIEEKA